MAATVNQGATYRREVVVQSHLSAKLNIKGDQVAGVISRISPTAFNARIRFTTHHIQRHGSFTIFAYFLIVLPGSSAPDPAAPDHFGQAQEEHRHGTATPAAGPSAGEMLVVKRFGP